MCEWMQKHLAAFICAALILTVFVAYGSGLSRYPGAPEGETVTVPPLPTPGETISPTYGDSALDNKAYTPPPPAAPSPETLEKFGIVYDDIPDFAAYDDEKLMIYCLGADGAYAEGSFHELAGRFLQAPDELCRIMLTSEVLGAPERDTLCFYIAVDNALSGRAAALRAALHVIASSPMDTNEVTQAIADALAWVETENP